jgi:thermostable 8-oxoguanine DNA glycosylase
MTNIKMVDSYNITDFNRSEEDLQEFLVFSVCVAGKTAFIMEKLVNNFIYDSMLYEKGMLPFEVIRRIINNRVLEEEMRRARLGKYTLLKKCFPELIDINVKTCTIEDLENIKGIGRKTSRFFLMHSREGFQCAALDTHILKYLRSLGYDAPKSTPGNDREYRRLEEIFIYEANQANKSVADYDLEIWRKYAKR